MFKQLLGRKKDQDVRFIKSEQYRPGEKQPDITIQYNNSQESKSSSPLKVSALFPNAKNDAFNNDIQTIRNQRQTENKKPYSFKLKTAAQQLVPSKRTRPSIDTTLTHDSASHDINDSYLLADAIVVSESNNELKSAIDNRTRLVTKTIGIFSDSQAYSDIIKLEVQSHDIEAKQVNEASALSSDLASHLEDVSAWIIHLSDEDNSEFLDDFLDKHFEKSALFLFEATDNKKSLEKVEQFIIENGLSS
jgi:hypothetical protein